MFSDHVERHKQSCSKRSVFDQRTEEASASQYFQFYGYLSQQQNMMQDYVRTFTYQKAMVVNPSDFSGKIVLDVGAGSGILSFFAIQAGAKHVYAVEASNMAEHCKSLVRGNGYEEQITVICGKIEEVSLPEKVDVIVSEPMGYMLVNERMLESFLHAKKFLKDGGKMYPTRGDLHMVPFTDEALFLEQCGKAAFWAQEHFHGVNVSGLRRDALLEYLRQPIVDTFDARICLAQPQSFNIDFATLDESELHVIKIPLSFHLLTPGYIHGLAFWFDVAFIGTNQTVWLSTSPTEPLTHWYQVRCLLPQPLLGRQGQLCTGQLILKANSRQSYDVEMELTCGDVSSKNTLDLKNPLFRYTGPPTNPPAQSTSPTEAYWNAFGQSASDAVNVGMNHLTNGVIETAMDIQTDNSRYPGVVGHGFSANGNAGAGGLRYHAEAAGDYGAVNKQYQTYQMGAGSGRQTGAAYNTAGQAQQAANPPGLAAAGDPSRGNTAGAGRNWAGAAALPYNNWAGLPASGGAATISSWSTQQHWAAGTPPRIPRDAYHSSRAGSAAR